MSEVIEILKRIENKLNEIDKRLRRIEEEFFDELSEDELRELEEDLKAYREGKLEMITLKRSKESFKVKLSPKAKKFLDKLPKNDRGRILSALRTLRENLLSLDIFIESGLEDCTESLFTSTGRTEL